ncbi:hypothetical protein KFL_004450130 [Klebsormidium nitens]|uniref:Reverse transcriptase Ty1/copia-type domain-containing protein n=1 Tax=Klebsormidium nitens TaxID=105231 RepID=A0A1Y1IIU7_KLENI|nr:hypothetical protein KFL_004450130 [Klebsormidium nitens]|eukprot:GAQ88626.1 hypothetical protein KFL_004450130 [Klebsormidium nitens]
MQQLQGYEQGGPNVVYHLKRTLYGLRQAPRAWHTRLKEELGNFEFVASLATRRSFVSGGRGADLRHCVGGRHSRRGPGGGADCEDEGTLAENFDVRDLREARTLKLTQKKLTGELLGRQGLAGARARSVPLGARKNLTKEGAPLDTARLPYSELIGSLLYFSVCTRPDIAQAVGASARYTSAPLEAHWAAALGVVRYLAGTAEAAITFGGSGEVLEAFCDADYAGDIDTKRSTTGYVFLMYGGAEVELAYCETEDMKADILTKALAPGKFLNCKKEIGIA